MLEAVFARNAELRAQLLSLTGRNGPQPPQPAAVRPAHWVELPFEVVRSADAPSDLSEPIDVVVTPNEINERHGTGPLVKRIFAGRRGIFSIRSRDDWGVHNFGDWHVKLSQQGANRAWCFRNVLHILRGRRVRSLLCVPFLQEELLTSIAIKEAFGAKLCLYLMDDQNVAANTIPDALMREFLEKCSLRLVTHPELRVAYQRKYNLPFYLLPAVVPNQLVMTELVAPPAYSPNERPGALLGSFWDQSWFDRLCAELRRCHSRLNWYGNNKSPWLKFPEEQLAAAGIRPLGVVPEPQLAEDLRRYPFVMVPAGAMDNKEKNTGVASLSLPGRILFAAATSHTPILVVGSEQSCAARFVKHFGIGLAAPYESSRIAAAIDRLLEPEIQQEMRGNAVNIAPAFSDRGIVEWLPASIEKGSPADSRFEDVFAGYNAERELSLSAVSCG
jgi:hypothetical protein